MARITVEDCVERIPNRFQLVLTATKRARQITRGATPLLAEQNDKATVIALREIADGLVDASVLNDKPENPLDVDEDAPGEASILPDPA